MVQIKTVCVPWICIHGVDVDLCVFKPTWPIISIATICGALTTLHLPSTSYPY